MDENLDGSFVHNGTFGFASLADLAPSELSLLATGTSVERLLFSIMRWDRQFIDGILDLLMETEEDDFELNQIGREKVRAVTRMLLLPPKSDTTLLRRHATGPEDAPFESLVMPHQDRLLSNIKLLHSTYSYIPRTRAPPVSATLYIGRIYHYIELKFNLTHLCVSSLLLLDKCPLRRQTFCLQNARRTASSMGQKIVSWFCTHIRF
mgnify:CR=1 FL=1